jgi:hypothetical protein
MRHTRRGESVLETIGGIVVFLLVVAGVIWFITGKNPIPRVMSGKNPLPPVASGENPLAPSIVGRWDVVRSGTIRGKDVAGYMRFNKDGTFTSTLAFLATTDGKFKVLSGSVVELDFPGVFYGRNKVEFKYKLDKVSLTLQANSHSIDLEFRRVD